MNNLKGLNYASLQIIKIGRTTRYVTNFSPLSQDAEITGVQRYNFTIRWSQSSLGLPKGTFSRAHPLTHIYTRTLTYTSTHTHIPIYPMCTRLRTLSHKYVQRHTFAHTRICTYGHEHTHTRTRLTLTGTGGRLRSGRHPPDLGTRQGSVGRVPTNGGTKTSSTVSTVCPRP